MPARRAPLSSCALVGALLAASTSAAAGPEAHLEERPSLGGRGGLWLGDRKAVRAVAARGRIVLDGKADDEVWQRAPVDDRMVERRPRIGAEPTRKTRFQVAYDERALYVYVECEAPGGGVSRTLERDNFRLFSGDAISVKLDPGPSRRTAFSFAANPAGARLDALGYNNGAVFEGNWDGVWEVATHRTEAGFSLEYRIPFALIGVSEGAAQQIGFNLTRDTPRGETHDWSLLSPPLSPMAASRFGALLGVENPGGGRLVELMPYALARAGLDKGVPLVSFDPRARPNALAGGEARVQVAPAAYVEASVLTDFAEADVDSLQVQTGRFPLFFPERRQFFLRGLEVLDFGLPGEAQAFFTRRVGLEGGRPVQLLGGTKAYGRQGPVTFAALDVVTTPQNDLFGDLPLRPFAAPERDRRPAKVADHVFVTRGKLRATPSTTVGGVLLGSTPWLEPGAPGGEYFAAGLDGRATLFESRLVAEGFGLASVVADRDRPPRTGFSGHGSVRWQGRFFRPEVETLFSDEDFEARLGFYRRPGTWKVRAAGPLAYQPSFAGLREVAITPSASVTLTPDGKTTLSEGQSLAAQVGFANGASLSVDASRSFELVDEAFKLFGVEVPAGVYENRGASFSVSSPTTYPASGEVGYSTGTYWTGRRSQLSGRLELQPNRYFYLLLDGSAYAGELFDERYAFGVFGLNSSLTLTPTLALSALAQASFAPGGERALAQLRLRWRWTSGSDLFVVYRGSWDLAPDLDAARPDDDPVRGPFAVSAPVGETLGQQALTLKVTFYLPTTLP